MKIKINYNLMILKDNYQLPEKMKKKKSKLRNAALLVLLKITFQIQKIKN